MCEHEKFQPHAISVNHGSIRDYTDDGEAGELVGFVVHDRDETDEVTAYLTTFEPVRDDLGVIVGRVETTPVTLIDLDHLEQSGEFYGHPGMDVIDGWLPMLARSEFALRAEEQATQIHHLESMITQHAANGDAHLAENCRLKAELTRKMIGHSRTVLAHLGGHVDRSVALESKRTLIAASRDHGELMLHRSQARREP